MSDHAVIGLDLSLRSTGIADAAGNAYALKTDKLVGMERIEAVRLAVLDALPPPDERRPGHPFVVVEGYAFQASGRSGVSLGELGGVIRHSLWQARVSWIEVAPNTVKKYATGNGSAAKVDVLLAARARLGYDGNSFDAADALWLRAIGLDLAGAPPAVLPRKHRDALVTLGGGDP